MSKLYAVCRAAVKTDVYCLVDTWLEHNTVWNALLHESLTLQLSVNCVELYKQWSEKCSGAGAKTSADLIGFCSTPKDTSSLISWQPQKALRPQAFNPMKGHLFRKSTFILRFISTQQERSTRRTLDLKTKLAIWFPLLPIFDIVSVSISKYKSEKQSTPNTSLHRGSREHLFKTGHVAH